MGRMSKIMWLEAFRDSNNSDTIDDLQTMTMCGMFDDRKDSFWGVHDDDLF
ncbi:MAG: hypothetical protein J6C94_04460 [Alistipes sp.]|nr:hypothetical protein [Alistipes sp.]